MELARKEDFSQNPLYTNHVCCCFRVGGVWKSVLHPEPSSNPKRTLTIMCGICSITILRYGVVECSSWVG